MSTTEGSQFAERMNSLFIEASAKTAVGVRETFQEVVQKILDTPELWASSTTTHAKSSAAGRKPGAAESTGPEMPGYINLRDDNNGSSASESGGCSC